jgi:hypothetical protein
MLFPALLHLVKLTFRWHDTGLREFWKKWLVVWCFLFEMFAFVIVPGLTLSGRIVSGIVALVIGLIFYFLPVRITPREFEEPEWLMTRIVAVSWVISLVGFIVIPK